MTRYDLARYAWRGIGAALVLALGLTLLLGWAALGCPDERRTREDQ